MTAKTQSAIAELVEDIAHELTELDLAGVITKPFRPLELPAQITEILDRVSVK